MNCLAPGGRYIEIAMTALKSAKSVDLSVLHNNQSFHSVDLRKLSLQNPDQVKDYQLELRRLAEEGVIQPVISKIFSFEDIKKRITVWMTAEISGKSSSAFLSRIK